MSSGLTYVTLYDYDTNNPQSGFTIQQFSSYDEAYEYGNWIVRNTYQTQGLIYIVAAIYTTGPNANGFWLYSSGVAIWQNFD